MFLFCFANDTFLYFSYKSLMICYIVKTYSKHMHMMVLKGINWRKIKVNALLDQYLFYFLLGVGFHFKLSFTNMCMYVL